MALSPPSRSRTRVAVVVVAAATLVAVGRTDIGVVRSLREGASTALDPVANVVDSATSPVRNAWHGITDYDHVKDENDQLRAEIAQARADKVAGTDAAKQLAALNKAINLPFAANLKKATARVVSGPRSNFSHSLVIDKGRSSGIAIGMPAATGAGLVGKVTQVTNSTATIQLVTDPDFRVGVRLVTTGDLGTARGQGRDEPLSIDSSISPSTKVARGTGLTTSGVDRSAFPPGLPVATVSGVSQGSGGLSLDLSAKPLVDIDNLSYVSVLLWNPQ